MDPFSQPSPISVYMRFRPLSIAERTSNESEIWSTRAESVQLVSDSSLPEVRKSATFPKSFVFSNL